MTPLPAGAHCSRWWVSCTPCGWSPLCDGVMCSSASFDHGFLPICPLLWFSSHLSSLGFAVLSSMLFFFCLSKSNLETFLLIFLQIFFQPCFLSSLWTPIVIVSLLDLPWRLLRLYFFLKPFFSVCFELDGFDCTAFRFTNPVFCCIQSVHLIQWFLFSFTLRWCAFLSYGFHWAPFFFISKSFWDSSSLHPLYLSFILD